MIPDYYVIGKRIREARIEKHMTQEELADQLDLSVAFLSRVEKGTSHINLKRLIQVAEILGLSPGEILTGSNILSQDYLRKDFSQVLTKCTPIQQKFIYKVAELVVETNVLED